MNQAVRITVTAREAVTDWLPVLDAAERVDVEITRVDGEPLLLTRHQVHARRVLVTELAVAVAAATVAAGADPLGDRLLDHLPWTRHLTAAERDAMAADLWASASAQRSATTGTAPFACALLAWYATAHAKAAGYTADAELDWFA